MYNMIHEHSKLVDKITSMYLNRIEKYLGERKVLIHTKYAMYDINRFLQPYKPYTHTHKNVSRKNVLFFFILVVVDIIER